VFTVTTNVLIDQVIRQSDLWQADVILRMRPEQAERIRLARSVGKLVPAFVEPTAESD
jgi:hypothetical protein